MFDVLLKVKEEYLSDKRYKENSTSYEEFSEKFAKFKEERRLFQYNPKKEQLFGRRYKS